MNIENPTILEKEKAEDDSSYDQTQKIIQELADRSRYSREGTTEGQEIITSPEGEKFSVGRIKDSSSPDVKKLFKFMKRFSPEECDTADIIKDAIENPTDAYAYYIVKNEKGGLIAHTQGSYLEMDPSPDRGEKGEAVLFLGYTVTDKKYERKGLALECNRGVFKFAAEKAKAKDQNLKAVIVEAVDASETLGNRLGMKRMYFEDREGNYREVPYVCPPIQWDEKTGQPVDPETGEIGTGDIHEYAAPEHLMLRMIDGRQEFTSEELMAILKPVYKDNYTLYRNPGEEFPTDDAIQSSVEAVSGFQEELKQILEQAEGGKILLLSAEDRKQKIAELTTAGKEFQEIVLKETEEE